MITATAFIAGTMLSAKLLGTDALGPALPALQVTHGRFTFALLAFLVATAVIRPAFTRPHWRLHIARTTCGALGVTLMFAAAACIPLSDATALSFLNPIFGMMLAIPLLGERVGPVRWGAAGIALIGAMILLRPGFATFQAAALLAVGAAMALGLELIFMKKLSGREKPLQILLVNNILGFSIASLVVIPVWQMPNAAQWAVLVALGVLMALAQTCFLNAVARAEASFITPFSYLTLVFVALYDGVAFQSWPNIVSLLGAGVIIAGAALLAFREARIAR